MAFKVFDSAGEGAYFAPVYKPLFPDGGIRSYLSPIFVSFSFNNTWCTWKPTLSLFTRSFRRRGSNSKERSSEDVISGNLTVLRLDEYLQQGEAWQTQTQTKNSVDVRVASEVPRQIYPLDSIQIQKSVEV